jgi:hypothetical protein
MIGEAPEYDIFISYRVNSDLEKVSALYDTLTSAGLKVWWDKKSLEPGIPWEVGFTDGLLKSRIFLPVFSRDAINHSSLNSQNFSSLHADSDCDNFLLELRLALEFKARCLVERIYPLMIGDLSLSQENQENIQFQFFGNYFRDGCHPKFNQNFAVLDVERKVNPK